jgi:hypothetical protein
MWNHYAAAVFKSKLPYTTIPSQRAGRLAGETHMNFFGLVLHGLSALSVYGDVIGVRLLVAAGVLLCAVTGVVAALFLPLGGVAGAPRPAMYLAGILLVLVFQVAVVSSILIFSILGGRANLTFLPIRDYRHFVKDVTKAVPASDPGVR